jgi:branched-chain amino acid transport system substrate-binding protein
MTAFSRRGLLAGAALAATLPAPFVRAQSTGPVRIGNLLSASGVFAVLGDNINRGMELGFEQVGNQAGGRAIELIREDDEVNPQIGLQKVKKLVEHDGCSIITGPVGSNVALAIAGYLKSADAVYICSGAGVNALTRERRAPNFFRSSTSSWQSNAPAGTWFAQNGESAITLVASDYSGGHEAADAFKAAYGAAGGRIAAEIYPPFGASDYSAYLPAMRDAGAPAIYAYMTGTDAVRFVQQFAQFGLKRQLRLLGTGFMVEQDALPAQGEAALGVRSGLHYCSTIDSAENRAFVTAYRAKYHETPSCYAEYGYVTARAITEALNATKGDSSRAGLIAALRGVAFAAPRGQFRFDPATQNVVNTIYIREVAQIDGALDNRVLATIPDQRDPG